MFATAHCEFHSLIFLFISETEEAFFNKTTENMACALFLLLVSFDKGFSGEKGPMKSKRWLLVRA